MQKRGIAILALVLKLQQIRPVNLYLLHEGDGRQDSETFTVVKLDTRPLDISVVCHTLTDVGFTRRLMFCAARRNNNFMYGWPRNYKQPEYQTRIRQVLNMTASDIYIKGALIGDELLNNPVAWVNKQIANVIDTNESGD